MTRWDLVYKWSDPATQSLVDAVTSALENCDRKLTEARAASASVPPLDENFIWLHPGRYSGEPCIGGHRLPTEVIAELVSAGDDGQTIIDGYDITRTQVILACWYEARHGQRRNWGDWLNDWEPAMWRGDFDDVPLPAAETPEQGRGDE